MTDAELAAWVQDCRDRVSPDRKLEEAFLALAARYRDLEEEVILRRLESLVRESGAMAVREALREAAR